MSYIMAHHDAKYDAFLQIMNPYQCAIVISDLLSIYLKSFSVSESPPRHLITFFNISPSLSQIEGIKFFFSEARGVNGCF